MTAFKCDICGAYYEPYHYYGNHDRTKPNAIMFYNDNAACVRTYVEKFDLCPDCMTAFQTVMDVRSKMGVKKGET